MSGRLEGQVAVVTGAGGGIGRAEAMLLASEGAQVVVNNRVRPGSTPSAEVVATEIASGGGEAVASLADVSSPEGARDLVRTALDAFGRLDIVLNNAGVARVSSVAEMSDDLWDEVLDNSLRGTFNVCRAAIPHLAAGSVILNTSSESGHGHAFLAAYAVAKEGVVALTRTLARELAFDGIRCNAIRPRALGTGMGERFVQEVGPFMERLGQLGRYRAGDRGGVGGAGTAEEAAPMAVWLCTPAARRITGQVFAIEGDTVGIWAEPAITRSAMRPGGWSLDELDGVMPASVLEGVELRGLSQLYARSLADHQVLA